MKAFAAACIAASASALSPMAVPDFVAGFMFGMTGQNHLTEIEACYQGSDKILADSKVAIADFKAGNYFKGVTEAGAAWNDVGAAMTTCKGMGDDITAIENWAKIFTEPTKLAETVGKRWLFHQKEIKADIAATEADWSAGQYFDAGKETAMALTAAVGPIQTGNEAVANLSVKAPIEFMAGMLDGLVGENHLTEMATCATDGETLLDDVEALIADLKAHKMVAAGLKAKKVASELHTTLGACESMGDDLKALEDWAKVFTSPTKVAEDFAKAMLLHKAKIDADVHSVESDWALHEYFQSGKAAADILYIVLGPVPTPTPTPTPTQSKNNLGMDLLAMPELAAGFVYGFVGDNHLAEMEACYAGTSPLFNYLESALKDIEGFHIFAALKELELFVYHFQLDVAPCTHMGEDLTAIEQWATIFKNPKSLVETATKHYLLHKKAVTADITAIKTDWAAGSYFATGHAAADLLTVLVGPVE